MQKAIVYARFWWLNTFSRRKSYERHSLNWSTDCQLVPRLIRRERMGHHHLGCRLPARDNTLRWNHRFWARVSRSCRRAQNPLARGDRLRPHHDDFPLWLSGYLCFQHTRSCPPGGSGCQRHRLLGRRNDNTDRHGCQRSNNGHDAVVSHGDRHRCRKR